VTLDDINHGPRQQVRDALLACADVPRWADAICDGRPFTDVASLMDHADRHARELTDDELARALAAHPRIGDRPPGDSTEATWSRQEQAGVQPDDELVEVNRAYEARFGRVFLICATGLTASDVIAAARARLANDEGTETAVAKDELRKIALLRLQKELDG
jgi:2-oxo-4-hydroxy-4-carboxy-5-ureidoimidazoline decarboxylase